ncbi:MAG: tRNA lysidine(34) synthetase TilS [Bryobacteraceae bacterium]|nr:tRNA lysidine(34) synthetase TilS [Bryobacteraceae bacterium]
MLDAVERYILRFRMLAPGQRVGVAVSGGADSVALLHALFQLRHRFDVRLSVLHFNHRLRGAESEGDEAFVAGLARHLQLEFHRAEGDPRLAPGNLEEEARRLRRAFFRSLLQSGALDRVALGHTRRDQAETVLFRLIRGAGLTGLGAMRPVSPEGFIRPLLDCDRPQLEAWLRDLTLPWREDVSNTDLRFSRNRIRHRHLPELRQENARIDLALARLATLAQEDEAYWTPLVAPLADNPLNVITLQAMPAALARRVIRLCCERAKGDLRAFTFEHIDRILQLAHNPRGSGQVRLPGLRAIRSFEWILFSPPHTAFPEPHVHLQVIERKAHSSEIDPYVTVEAAKFSDLRPELADCPLVLRGWRLGDRYRPAGHAHDLKLKVLFHRARVPSWERGGWPILTVRDRIVWTKRFGAAHEFAARPDDTTVLRVFADLPPSSESGSGLLTST